MKKLVLSTLAGLLAPFVFAQTFNYTGAVQTYTVPAAVTSVTIQTYGAEGGASAIGGSTGLGGYATGTLAVTPGDILYIYVGGQNGYNGGGAGAANGNPATDFAGNGGGASDVRLNGTALANRVIVAGGGGGAGSNGTWPGCQVAGPAGNGGAGGGLTGGSGTLGVGTPCNCQGGGGDGAIGGSQIAGGIHGNYAGNTACLRANWTAGQDGTLAQGGNGSTIFYNGTGGGGGGGGGYYGGGAGGSGSDTTPGGGGGGGSSFTGSLTSASTTSGTRSGNGMVIITAPVSQAFNYTGSVQMFTVPSCVSSVTIQSYGAQGGVAAIGGSSGLGGYAIGTLAVTPGDILYIYVGGQNGYNGGGAGAANGNPATDYAGTGGGASDVRLNGTSFANLVIVAGGGGGAGSNGTWPGCQVAGPAGNGGAGGGLTGGSGTLGVGTPCNCQGGGGDGATGGSQIAGGIHGNYAGNTACLRANWTAGLDGTFMQGGNGSTIFYNGTGGGGGGGGGYYGGGAGGSGSDTTPGGGGGGGSSFTGSLSSASTTSGTRSGDGMVVISYNSSGTIPASPVSITGSNAVCTGATSLNYSISSVVGATSYTWTVPAGSTITSGQGTTAIVVTAGSTSGNITVTANNACGSSAPTQLALTINPLPTLTVSAATLTPCVNDGLDALTGSPAGGVWSGPGVTGNNFNPTVTGAQILTYNYTDAVTGCSNSASLTINVLVCMNITEQTLENGVSVFPNPSTGVFNLKVNANVGDLLIEVTDLQGRVVFTSMEKNVNAGFSKEINLTNVSTGIYMMKLSSGNEHVVQQITVEK